MGLLAHLDKYERTNWYGFFISFGDFYTSGPTITLMLVVGLLGRLFGPNTSLVGYWLVMGSSDTCLYVQGAVFFILFRMLSLAGLSSIFRDS